MLVTLSQPGKEGDSGGWQGREGRRSRQQQPRQQGGLWTCTPPLPASSWDTPGAGAASSPSSGWPRQTTGQFLLLTLLKLVLHIPVLCLSMTDPKTTAVLQGRNSAFASLR